MDGLNPNVTNTPPAPSVTVLPVVGGTGSVVSWEPNQGPVTGYTIYRNGVAIATVSSNQLAYTNSSDPTGANDYASLYSYAVRANYAAGNSSLSAAQQGVIQDYAVSVGLVRGTQGQEILLAPHIPAGVTTLKFYPESEGYDSTQYPWVYWNVYLQPTNYLILTPGEF